MLRLTILLLLVFFSHEILGQKLICPPDKSQACYDTVFDKPVIEDGAGLELESEREFEGNSCDYREVTITYKLIDPINEEERASCSHVITIRPYNSQTLFPADTILTGKTISEVLNQSVYTDGMFPLGNNECNITFTYEDLLVEMYPNAFIFRHWSATNECDNTVVLSTQDIRLTELPHNTIATQVRQCGGREILIDEIEILHNDVPVQLGDCFVPFDSLYQTLNCLADSLLVNPDETLSLRLHDITDPYIGITTRDIVDIQRHVLGLKRFEEPCRLSAADVNRDGRINGLDLFELRKLILGIYTTWPYGDGPELRINGEVTSLLSFTKGDFPLEKLEIVVTNQGNPSTN